MITPTGKPEIDTAVIQSALDRGGCVAINGQFRTVEPLAMRVGKTRLFGCGWGASEIQPVNNSFPAIVMGGNASRTDYLQIVDIAISGGLHAVVLDNAPMSILRCVRAYRAASHGIVVRNNGWCHNLTDVEVRWCDGDGINAQGTPQHWNGNSLTLAGCWLWSNAGAGLRWTANTLSVSGGLCEKNGDCGIIIESTPDRPARGFDISGVHFEKNVHSQIRLIGSAKWPVSGGDIHGNLFYSDDKEFTLVEAFGEVTRVIGVEVRANCAYGPARYCNFTSESTSVEA